MANAFQEKQTAPRALETVRHEFDELIDRFFGTKPLSIQRFHALLNEPAIESFIEGDKMVVRAEMPGVDPRDVEVTVSGNMLTIRGKREQQHEEKGRDFLQREISYEEMERSIMNPSAELPGGTTADAVQKSLRQSSLGGAAAKEVPSNRSERFPDRETFDRRVARSYRAKFLQSPQKWRPLRQARYRSVPPARRCALRMPRSAWYPELCQM